MKTIFELGEQVVSVSLDGEDCEYVNLWMNGDTTATTATTWVILSAREARAIAAALNDAAEFVKDDGCGP